MFLSRWIFGDLPYELDLVVPDAAGLKLDVLDIQDSQNILSRLNWLQNNIVGAVVVSVVVVVGETLVVEEGMEQVVPCI